MEGRKIIAAVADEMGTTVKDILSSSRFREHTDARHLAIRLLAEAGDRSRPYSVVELSSIMGMDRTSITYALDRFDTRMRYNPVLADCYRRLTSSRIALPFPPSSLSGHNKGAWWSKSGVVAKHRSAALEAVKEAAVQVPEDGDIPLHIHFVPPDNRGDRTNYWNRCKAYIDGIAEGLGLNDKRFLPSMSFAPPQKPGRVEITLG